MKKITKIVGAIAVLLMICITANAISSVNQGFMAGWFAGDGGNITGLNADNIAIGTLADARLPSYSTNIKNIMLRNDAFAILNSYWDFVPSTSSFNISWNATSPSDTVANTNAYIHTVLQNNSNGGRIGLVSRGVNDNNGTGALIGIASSVQTNGNNGSNSGAWGGWFASGQTDNGYAVGTEINTNSNTNRTTIDGSSVYGMQISTLGTKVNTAGILISSTSAPSRYEHGMYIQDATYGITIPAAGITSGIALNATGLIIKAKIISLPDSGIIQIKNSTNTALWNILVDTDGGLKIYNTTSVLKVDITQTGGMHLPAYVGTGTQYACFDASGNLVRSASACS